MYEAIYLLKPDYESEPGWWKLKWRPIRKQTWSFYRDKWRSRGIGICWHRADAHNGWGRSYEHLFIEILTPWTAFTFWIKWNFVVMADGPSDMEPRTPLDLSGVKR